MRRIGAGRQNPGDTVARRALGDLGTDALHHAGSFGARRHRQRPLVKTAAQLRVEEVHAGRANANAHLPRAGRRQVGGLERQNLRAAMRAHHDATTGARHGHRAAHGTKVNVRLTGVAP